MDDIFRNQAEPTVYEQIGHGYTHSRRADPRWEAQIHKSFTGAETLINIGAGSGSYEPDFLTVVAVEPSPMMIRQRPPASAPVVCANAELLPFADGFFDVALAVLTTHHWRDARAGLLEMCRVARSQVVVTWDPNIFTQHFWLVRDYLPEIAERERDLPTLNTVMDVLGSADVTSLPVPADCVDGILGAYWRRPQAYLSHAIRRAMSGIALLDPGIVEPAMQRLQADLTNGVWQTRNAELLALDELDLGYRLISRSDE